MQYPFPSGAHAIYERGTHHQADVASGKFYWREKKAEEGVAGGKTTLLVTFLAPSLYACAIRHCGLLSLNSVWCLLHEGNSWQADEITGAGLRGFQKEKELGSFWGS